MTLRHTYAACILDGKVGAFFRLGWALAMAAMFVVGFVAPGIAAKKKTKPIAEVPLEQVLSPNPMLLLDVDSGKVLYHRQGNQQWYPASLTKLMTAYVTFRALAAGELRPDSLIEISPHALSYPPSKMGFKVGTRVTIDNALKMVIVKSANDIAAALAERVAGSEAAFAKRMNRQAQRLGMTATHFVNANGLHSPMQKSSARDMAILARALLLDFPHYRPLFQIPAIRHGKRVLRSYNKLLETYSGTNGMKTGFVCASGYNLVAAANRGGRQLVAVVLGAPNVQSRAESAAHLLTRGFSQSNMVAGRGLAISDSALFGPMSDAVNMRPEICTKRSNPKWASRVKVIGSSLQPRFKVMEPVRVYAGVKKSNQRVTLPVQLAHLPTRAPFARAGKDRVPLSLIPAKKTAAPGLIALPKPKP